MIKRNFKDHTCKAVGCNKMAEKDSFGLYKTYCSDECNPRKKDRICENAGCNNPQPKNKYGNYIAYCCTECKKVSFNKKITNTYC